jgi:hypothetical protein
MRARPDRPGPAVRTLLVFLIAAIGITVVLGTSWRPLHASVGRPLLDEDLNDNGSHARVIGVVDGDGGFSQHGVVLAPGQHMDVRLPVSRVAPEMPTVTLWMYHAPGVSAIITCASDDGHFQPVAANVFTPVNVSATVPLTPCNGASTVVLGVHIERAPGAPSDPALVLDKIQVSASSGPSSAPDLIPLTTSWFVVGMAVWGGAVLSRRRWSTAAAGSAAVVALAATHVVAPAAFDPHESAFWLSPVIAASTCALALIAIAARRHAIGGEQTLEAIAFWLVLTWGFAARWQALVTMLEAPLSPDALTANAIVHQMRHLYDTGVREPLWPWLLRVSIWGVGDNPAAGRVFSLASSLALLGTTFLLARAYLRRTIPALAALWLVAVNPTLVDASADAHRTSLFAMALVVVALFASPSRLSRRRAAAGLAVGSAIVALTQLTGIIPTAAAVALAWIKKRVSTLGLVAITVATVAAIAPYGVYTQRTYGQMFYFTRTLVPTYYRNYEFMRATQTGCDGCPTASQMAANSYSGRPASMFEYLFTLHTPREVIRRTAAGYAALVLPGTLLAHILGWPSIPIYLCYLIGLGVAAFTRARELLLVPALSVNLLAFVIPLGIDSRLVLHLAPFAAILIVMGAAAVCRGAMWLWSPRLVTR